MKRIFAVIVFNFFVSALYGQLSSFYSQNQILIEEAVKDGFLIVRRCYQLRDTVAATPKNYGRDNLPYFGETYSLGIKTAEGYYLTDRAIRPWMYDSNFDDYAESRQYAPVLSTSEYRMPDDTIWQTLPDSSVSIKEISAQRLYLAQDTALFRQKGFSVDETDGVKKGWLVWLASDRPLAEQNDQTFSFLIYRSELTFEPGREVYEIKDPATSAHVLGGFYMLPEVTDIGHVVFHLNGILYHENGKWQVVRTNCTAGAAHAPQPVPAGGGLTPVEISPNADPNKQ